MAEWITGNRYLTQKEMDNNAELFYLKIYSQSVSSLTAISAMLGNMVYESNINPQIWENLTPNTNNGYGLTQWTPASKLIDWCASNGLDYTNGDSQVERIKHEIAVNGQWFKNYYAPNVGYPINPPITFAEFVNTDSLSIDDATAYFILYYEHPSESRMRNEIEKRRSMAKYYLEMLGGISPEPPEPPEPVPPIYKNYSGIPLIYFHKKRFFNL